jgi:hypothetical protein
MSWKAVIVPVRFFPLGYTIYNCVKHVHCSSFPNRGDLQIDMKRRSHKYFINEFYTNRRDWEKKNNDNIVFVNVKFALNFQAHV